LFFREGQSSAVSDVVNLPGGLLGVDTNAWVQEGAIRDAGGGRRKRKGGKWEREEGKSRINYHPHLTPLKFAAVRFFLFLKILPPEANA